MYQVILISHGKLAAGMMDSARLILGEQERGETFELALGDDIEAFRDRVTEAVERALKSGDVLVLTDIQSGSPFNVTVGIMTGHQVYHITGMNLPVVIEALSCRDTDRLSDKIEELTEIGKQGIIDVNRLLEQA